MKISQKNSHWHRLNWIVVYGYMYIYIFCYSLSLFKFCFCFRLRAFSACLNECLVTCAAWMCWMDQPFGVMYYFCEWIVGLTSHTCNEKGRHTHGWKMMGDEWYKAKGREKKNERKTYTSECENKHPTIYVNPFHGDVVTGGENEVVVKAIHIYISATKLYYLPLRIGSYSAFKTHSVERMKFYAVDYIVHIHAIHSFEANFVRIDFLSTLRWTVQNRSFWITNRH